MERLRQLQGGVGIEIVQAGKQNSNKSACPTMATPACHLNIIAQKKSSVTSLVSTRAASGSCAYEELHVSSRIA